jgi:hypothetical protein
VDDACREGAVDPLEATLRADVPRLLHPGTTECMRS